MKIYFTVAFLMTCLCFGRVSGDWIQVGSDIDGKFDGEQSGRSVSLSADGTVVAIGAPLGEDLTGHVRLYRYADGNWIQIGSDIYGKDEDVSLLGWSVSLSADGNIVAIGTPYYEMTLGRVHVLVRIYRNVNDDWIQIGSDIIGEGQSRMSGYTVSISLSGDGEVVAIGDPQNDEIDWESGQVRIYRIIDDNWIQLGGDIYGEEAGDRFGHTVSISYDGNVVVVCARENHTVRAYRYVDNTWMQLGNNITYSYILNVGSVSISSDGTIVAIGITKSGYSDGYSGYYTQVAVYRHVDEDWIQIGRDIKGELLCCSLSLTPLSISGDGRIIAFGELYNEGNAGQVQVYENIDEEWIQVGSKIVGEATYDLSGYAVSLSEDGTSVAIGAPTNDGNENSTYLEKTGHVRVFTFESNEMPTIRPSVTPSRQPMSTVNSTSAAPSPIFSKSPSSLSSSIPTNDSFAMYVSAIHILLIFIAFLFIHHLP